MAKGNHRPLSHEMKLMKENAQNDRSRKDAMVRQVRSIIRDKRPRTVN